MEKIIEYRAVGARSVGGLQEKVNASIREGFQPLGGISQSPGGIIQAMVKYEEAQTIPPVVVKSSKSLEKVMEEMGATKKRKPWE